MINDQLGRLKIEQFERTNWWFLMTVRFYSQSSRRKRRKSFCCQPAGRSSVERIGVRSYFSFTSNTKITNLIWSKFRFYNMAWKPYFW